jgi:hypothetical protein
MGYTDYVYCPSIRQVLGNACAILHYMFLAQFLSCD